MPERLEWFVPCNALYKCSDLPLLTFYLYTTIAETGTGSYYLLNESIILDIRNEL